MREQQVLSKGGIRDCAAVKPSALVPNCDWDFPVHVTAAVDVNALAWVFTVAVDHGIRKSFMQRHLNVSLATIRVSKAQNEAQELIREWGNGRDFTWERLAHLNEGNWMTISRQKR
jgi:hypothetical protein